MLAELMQKPRRLLLTLMIGNVTINMFIFALACRCFGAWARRRDRGDPRPVDPLLVTLVGDILPKSTAILLRYRLAPAAAPLIRLVQLALSPVIAVLLHGLVTPLTRLLAGPRLPDEYVTHEELAELIEMSEQHRIIDADENAMLGEVIRLSELHVYDVWCRAWTWSPSTFTATPPTSANHARAAVHQDPGLRRHRGQHLGVVYAKDLF